MSPLIARSTASAGDVKPAIEPDDLCRTALHLFRERNVLEIVFYDLSRRRERGGVLSAANAMDIIHSVSSGAVGLVGAMLAVVFLT